MSEKIFSEMYVHTRNSGVLATNIEVKTKPMGLKPCEVFLGKG